MKKPIMLLAVVSLLGVLCVALAVVLNFNEPTNINEEAVSFKSIVQVNFSDIAYIKTGDAREQKDDCPISDFIKEYGQARFKRFSDSTGSTAHVYFVAYDNNDQILFTLVDIGNRDLVYISRGTFDINEEDTFDKLYKKL